MIRLSDSKVLPSTNILKKTWRFNEKKRGLISAESNETLEPPSEIFIPPFMILWQLTGLDRRINLTNEVLVKIPKSANSA